MLCAEGAGGSGGAAGSLVGGGKFAKGGDSVAAGCEGGREVGGIAGRFCAGERAWRRETFVAAWAGEDFDGEYFRAAGVAGGSGGWRRRESHAAGGEDTGRMQQPVRVLRDSICAREKPKPGAGASDRGDCAAERGGLPGNCFERDQLGDVWAGFVAARGGDRAFAKDFGRDGRGEVAHQLD